MPKRGGKNSFWLNSERWPSSVVLGGALLLIGILALSVMIHLNTDGSSDSYTSELDASSSLRTSFWEGQASLTSSVQSYSVELVDKLAPNVLRDALQNGRLVLAGISTESQDLTLHIEAANYAPTDVGITSKTAVFSGSMGNVPWTGSYAVNPSKIDPGRVSSFKVSGKSIFYLSVGASSYSS